MLIYLIVVTISLYVYQNIILDTLNMYNKKFSNNNENVLKIVSKALSLLK